MQRLAQYLFAVGLGGLGVITLIYGDFALVWQPVPDWVPAHQAVAHGSGIVLLVCGIGLLLPVLTSWAAILCFAYCLLWASLKVPPLFAKPLVEESWLGLGELVVILAGAWVLFAGYGRGVKSFPRDQAARIARLLLGAAVIPIGLSHLVYLHQTATFVPHWFVFLVFFAVLTGVAQILCGICLLLSIVPAWAAILQASMYTAFTIFVWIPRITAASGGRFSWTAFFVSWIITAAAWIVAADLVARRRIAQKNG
jgi:uncharacterized membrane protein